MKILNLLEDVAGLVEHLLEVGEKLVQLLAAPRHKVTKPGFKDFLCRRSPNKFSPWDGAVLPAHPLNLQLALVDDLLQADRISMPDLS